MSDIEVDEKSNVQKMHITNSDKHVMNMLHEGDS
jgi:hypothetical protein